MGLENPSSRTEVSPLKRLSIEPRRSVGQRTFWKLFETTLGGNGGTGSVGARPGCPRHKLDDLGSLGDCVSCGFGSFESITYSPAPLVLTSEELNIALKEALRRFLIVRGFGFSAKFAFGEISDNGLPVGVTVSKALFGSVFDRGTPGKRPVDDDSPGPLSLTSGDVVLEDLVNRRGKGQTCW